jgi:hypothetical protein
VQAVAIEAVTTGTNAKEDSWFNRAASFSSSMPPYIATHHHKPVVRPGTLGLRMVDRIVNIEAARPARLPRRMLDDYVSGWLSCRKPRQAMVVS